MRQTINQGRVSYQPNSLGGGCPMQAKADMGGFVSYAEKLDGAIKVRARGEKFFDHFSQATLFWNSQSPAEKNHIIQALRFELGKVDMPAIRERMVGMLAQVDNTLATDVAKGLRLTVPSKLNGPLNMSVPADGNPKQFQPKPPKRSTHRSNALSMDNTVKGNINTRKIAILAADGVDDAAISNMKKALNAAGAQPKVIAPRIGMLKGANGGKIPIDLSFLTTGSSLFDAVYIPGGSASVEILKGNDKALQFVKEAYLHCKAIAATDGGIDLLSCSTPAVNKTGATKTQDSKDAEKIQWSSDEGIILGLDTRMNDVAKKFIAAIGQHRFWDRELKSTTSA
jgi:catalase